MTGKESAASVSPLQIVQMYFGTQHPLFRAMGIEIIAVENGRADMAMPCTARMCDAHGALHRGAMVTLLDNTCGLSIFSALGKVMPIATIDLRIDYFRHLPPGVGVRAIVDCVNTTETFAYIHGRAVTHDDAQLPLATVTGTFAINTMGPDISKVIATQGKGVVP